MATNPGHPALFCLGGFAPPRRWNSPLAESTIKSCWAQVTTERPDGQRGKEGGSREGAPPLPRPQSSFSHLSSPALSESLVGWLAGWRVRLGGSLNLGRAASRAVVPHGAGVGVAGAAAAAPPLRHRDMHPILPLLGEGETSELSRCLFMVDRKCAITYQSALNSDFRGSLRSFTATGGLSAPVAG